MKRREFIRSVSVLGAAAVVPSILLPDDAHSQHLVTIEQTTKSQEFTSPHAWMRHTVEVLIERRRSKVAIVRVRGHIENAECGHSVWGRAHGLVNFTDGTQVAFACAGRRVPAIGLGDRPHTGRPFGAPEVRHSMRRTPIVRDIYWLAYEVHFGDHQYPIC